MTAALLEADTAPDRVKLVQQAAAVFEGGDALGAAGSFLDLLEADPHDAEALIGLGRCDSRLRRPEDALRWFRLAAGHAPDEQIRVRAALHAAEQLQALGRLAEAEAALSPADALTDSWATARRAAILIDLGRFEEAEGLLGLIPQSEGGLEAHRTFLLGLIALRTWRLRAAEQWLRTSARVRPGALAQLAAVQVMQLDLEPAFDTLAERARIMNETGAAPRDSTARPLRFLMGNILNELLLDPEAAAAALAAPDLEALRAAVLAHPDRLGPALSLLLHLRRADHLHEVEPAMTAIPRRIVQAWFGSPTPRDVLEVAEGWRAAHPDWQVELFTMRTAADHLGDIAGREAVKALRAARHPAAAADVFRLATLAACGGVWVDADDRCLAPLDPLIAGRSFVGFQEQFGFVANDILAAAPGHPLMVAALERAQDAVLRGYGEATWLATGPGLLTRAAADLLAAGGALTLLELHQIRAFAAIGVPLAYKQDARNWRRA